MSGAFRGGQRPWTAEYLACLAQWVARVPSRFRATVTCARAVATRR
ncbi:MAG TPA: hypothetical protein VMI73_21170 [Trebonia sp.]|nr:hypothetical protein [Trebonia sp.]